MRDERLAHIMADLEHPQAIAERQAEAAVQAAIDRLQERPPIKTHEYEVHVYWCRTCNRPEIDCRAERGR
jgi:hypothetical protein